MHALKLTLEVAVVAVPLNTIFGVLCGLAIVRHRIPGMGLVNAIVDLPMALSPVVVGLALYLLYANNGWFGTWLTQHGVRILFAYPGILLATIFVSLPFVVREVVPVLREIGTEQEEAAATLGANAFTIFRRITLPAIQWAVVYGVVLTMARALGEFGAVAIVSGGLAGRTQTMTQYVQAAYENGANETGAYAASVVLAAIAILTLSLMTVFGQGRTALAIEAHNVTKRFGDFVALDDVSINVESGSLTALLGPSGSGKSTLLRVIAGLEVADSGDVFISGKEATALAPQKRGVGFVFQHYAPFKHMTVWENVAFGLKIRRRPKDEVAARVEELLQLVQLGGLGGRYPAQLSGGQRQRMALARALAPEPEVLLLDEPFGALDARVRVELRQWLLRLHDEMHVTTIFVTHDQEEALELSDSIVVMNKGRVEQIAPPRQLYDEPANEFVMSFVGPVNKLDDAWVRPHDVELGHEPNGVDARGADRAHRPARLRDAGRARARRRRAALRAADAERGRGARARARRHRLRAHAQGEDLLALDLSRGCCRPGRSATTCGARGRAHRGPGGARSPARAAAAALRPGVARRRSASASCRARRRAP